MKTARKLGAAALAASLAVATAIPVSAAPFGTQPQGVSNAPIVLAQSGPRDFRRDFRRGDRNDGPRYKGYRGSRDYRSGWRRHNNGWWYPLAAFGIGAAIGATIAQPRAVAPRGNAHTAWCYSQYRSYRAWDNTFQPYNGPRRVCISPYYG